LLDALPDEVPVPLGAPVDGTLVSLDGMPG
jgi:hypothetical protein